MLCIRKDTDFLLPYVIRISPSHIFSTCIHFYRYLFYGFWLHIQLYSYDLDSAKEERDAIRTQNR